MNPIGAHWYSREETLRKCTEDLLFFLEELKTYDTTSFGVWYQKGWSKKEALQNKVEFDYDYVKKLFSKRDKDDAYPKTAYITGIWTGQDSDEDTAALSVTLGSSEPRYFTNNCVLDLPYNSKYQNVPQELIDLFKKHWNPEWIMVNDERFNF